MFSTRYFDPDESIEFWCCLFYGYSTVLMQCTVLFIGKKLDAQIGENLKFPKSSVFYTVSRSLTRCLFCTLVQLYDAPATMTRNSVRVREQVKVDRER
jgi:hypothetical protein